MTSQHIDRRHAFASLAAVVCVAVALSVHAAYSSDSTAQGVMDSCKDFSIGGDGVLSATCNVWSAQGDRYRYRDHNHRPRREVRHR